MDLGKSLENFSENIDCLYLVGDRNIDLLKQYSPIEKYTNVLIYHGVEQTIPEATRIGEKASTLIAHIICNIYMFLSNEVIPLL